MPTQMAALSASTSPAWLPDDFDALALMVLEPRAVRLVAAVWGLIAWLLIGAGSRRRSAS
jgi:hypothetical protein